MSDLRSESNEGVREGAVDEWDALFTPEETPTLLSRVKDGVEEWRDERGISWTAIKGCGALVLVGLVVAFFSLGFSKFMLLFFGMLAICSLATAVFVLSKASKRASKPVPLVAVYAPSVANSFPVTVRHVSLPIHSLIFS